MGLPLQKRNGVLTIIPIKRKSKKKPVNKSYEQIIADVIAGREKMRKKRGKKCD